MTEFIARHSHQFCKKKIFVKVLGMDTNYYLEKANIFSKLFPFLEILVGETRITVRVGYYFDDINTKHFSKFINEILLETHVDVIINLENVNFICSNFAINSLQWKCDFKKLNRNIDFINVSKPVEDVFELVSGETITHI